VLVSETMTVVGATHFYKYKAPPAKLEYLEDTIVRHKLYFPLPRELNDPVEARPRLVVSPEEIEHLLLVQWQKENPAASENDISRILNDIRDGIALMGQDELHALMTNLAHERYGKRRIFSLSKRWDNMGMWAKYAADHHGYCLEFANAGLFAHAREVEYVNVVTENLTDDSDLGNFYFRKTRDWLTEEEVRVVASRNAFPKVTIDPALLTQVIVGKDTSRNLST
jgi:hypothetical protein